MAGQKLLYRLYRIATASPIPWSHKCLLLMKCKHELDSELGQMNTLKIIITTWRSETVGQ